MKALNVIGVVLVLTLSVVPALYSGAEIGGAEITYHPDGQDPVIFSHKVHVEEFDLDCSQCHGEVFAMNRDNFSEPKRNLEAIMDLMAEGRYCGHCHDDSRAFTVEENCELCHVMRTED